MYKWVRTIGFSAIKKLESPFHALWDLSFYPHPENVLSPANTLFPSWYQTAFFSIVGAHLVSLVLRQYKVSVSNITILQSYFSNKKHENVSKYLIIIRKCDCCTCIEVMRVPQDSWFQYSAYGALRFQTGEIPSFLLPLSIHLRPRFGSTGQEDHTQSMENL